MFNRDTHILQHYCCASVDNKHLFWKYTRTMNHIIVDELIYIYIYSPTIIWSKLFDRKFKIYSRTLYSKEITEYVLSTCFTRDGFYFWKCYCRPNKRREVVNSYIACLRHWYDDDVDLRSYWFRVVVSASPTIEEYDRHPLYSITIRNFILNIYERI